MSNLVLNFSPKYKTFSESQEVEFVSYHQKELHRKYFLKEASNYFSYSLEMTENLSSFFKRIVLVFFFVFFCLCMIVKFTKKYNVRIMFSVAKSF